MRIATTAYCAQVARSLGADATGIEPFGVTAPAVRVRSFGVVAAPIGVDDFGAFDPFVSRRGAKSLLVDPPTGVDALAEKLRCVALIGT